MNVWLTETYFDHLRSDCFSDPRERTSYDTCLRLLHEIPFYWTIWSDENRAGDALAYRQSEFLGYQSSLESIDPEWLKMWSAAAPSVLEVLLGMARRYESYFEEPTCYYFQEHLFKNLGLTRYHGRVLSTARQDAIRDRIDEWLSRTFEPNGQGSPFPLHHPYTDMRTVEIWAQMNAYSAEHFQ